MPKKGKSSIQDRLHRIEGQIRGIESMVKEEKDVTQIITQIQAVSSSLESVKLELVKEGIKDNVEKGIYEALDLLK
jgi:DNA-binding FrmR family transcriptional regulator